MLTGQAVKHDTEKSRADLLPVLALSSVGDVLGYGAKKYAEHNWRLGMSWGRMLGAALRHLFAFMRGEDLDPESGLPHLAHASCCCLMVLEYFLTKTGADDRWKPE